MSMLWSGQGGSKSNKGKTERSGLGFGWSSARPSASEDPAKGRSKSFADLHQRQDEKSRPGHEANPSRQEIIGPYNSSSGLEYDYAGVHAHEKVRPSDDGSLSCEHCGRSEIYPDHGSHRAVYNNSHSKPNDYPYSQRSAKSKLQKGINRLKEEVSNDGSRLEQLDPRVETTLKNMQQDIQQLETMNQCQTNRIAELSSKLQIEEENNMKLKESTNKMLVAMENKDLFIGRQDTDDVVRSRFDMLVRKVFTWSVPFAQHEAPPSLDDFPQLHLQSIQRILPNVIDFNFFLQFLQNSKNIRLFVRGWVNFAISEMLFRTLSNDSPIASETQDVWMDSELAQAVHQIEIGFFKADPRSISSRDLHDWRALTTSLISKQATSSKIGKGMEGRVNECRQRILAVVRPLSPRDRRAQLEEDLDAILLQAVKLSQTLRCQRASWSIRHPLPAQAALRGSPVFLNPSVMEDKNKDDDSDNDEAPRQYRKIVKIVMSPALFKRGNTDGEQFDVEACVQRAEVVCILPPIPTKAHGLPVGAHYEDYR